MKINHAYIPCFFLILFISCATTVYQSSNVKEFTPKETDVPGWGLIQKRVHLSIKQIAAQHHELHRMGIVEWEQAGYLSYSDKKSTIAVDVFRAGSVLDAFGIFSIERSKATNPVSITGEEYFVDTGLFTHAGNFYIRIITNKSDYRTRSELEAFKKIIMQKITPAFLPGSIPPFIAQFCNENQLPQLVYYKNGHPLVPGTVETFIIDDENKTFFIKNPSVHESRLLYNDILKQSPFTISKTGDIQLALKGAENRFIFISFRDIWIFGVLNAENITVGNEFIQKLYDRFTPAKQ